MLIKNEVTEKNLSRCANCYKIAENEFMPILCNRCYEEPAHGNGVLLPSHAAKGNNKYIEVDFFQPIADNFKHNFILLLWLTYETHENHLATWQGVLSVTRSRPGETLLDKFDSYAKSLVPAYKTVFDVICCKVEKQAAG